MFAGNSSIVLYIYLAKEPLDYGRPIYLVQELLDYGKSIYLVQEPIHLVKEPLDYERATSCPVTSCISGITSIIGVT